VAEPKSHSLKFPSWPRRTLSSFRSRWI